MSNKYFIRGMKRDGYLYIRDALMQDVKLNRVAITSMENEQGYGIVYLTVSDNVVMVERDMKDPRGYEIVGEWLKKDYLAHLAEYEQDDYEHHMKWGMMHAEDYADIKPDYSTLN